MFGTKRGAPAPRKCSGSAATAAPTKDGERRSDVMIKREMLVGIDRSKSFFAVQDRDPGSTGGAKKDWSVSSAPLGV